MKKNRRKKDKGVPRMPDGKQGPIAKAQITFVSFDTHLKPETGEASESLGLQILRDADVVIGGDSEGNRAPFYGTEWLQEVANGKIDEAVLKQMVFVSMEAENFQQQAEELRKIVEELKGSCCYGGNVQAADEADWYMFTRHGKIVYYKDEDKYGMILAPNRSLGEQFAALQRKGRQAKVSIAQIGTVPGETLNGLLDKTLKEGATCAFVVKSVNDKGGEFDVLLPPEDPRTP